VVRMVAGHEAQVALASMSRMIICWQTRSLFVQASCPRSRPLGAITPAGRSGLSNNLNCTDNPRYSGSLMQFLVTAHVPTGQARVRPSRAQGRQQHLHHQPIHGHHRQGANQGEEKGGREVKSHWKGIVVCRVLGVIQALQ
jgi:hypothetical protein